MPGKKRKRKADKNDKTSNRPKKYKTWTEESMKAVADGAMDINRAADKHGVPRINTKCD